MAKVEGATEESICWQGAEATLLERPGYGFLRPAPIRSQCMLGLGAGRLPLRMARADPLAIFQQGSTPYSSGMTSGVSGAATFTRTLSGQARVRPSRTKILALNAARVASAGTAS